MTTIIIAMHCDHQKVPLMTVMKVVISVFKMKRLVYRLGLVGLYYKIA